MPFFEIFAPPSLKARYATEDTEYLLFCSIFIESEVSKSWKTGHCSPSSLKLFKDIFSQYVKLVFGYQLFSFLKKPYSAVEI